MKRSLYTLVFLVLASGLVASGCGDGEPDTSGDGDGAGTGGSGGGDGTCGSGDGDSCRENQEVCDGFCTSVESDPENCGDCGNECGAGEACFSGECGVSECGTGLVSCDGVCADLQTSDDHCGACGDACASGEACANGQCEVSCPVDFLTCDGVCIDPSKDRNYCGATSCDNVGAGGASGGNGEVCEDAELCFEGACVASCPSGQIACGDTCVDPLNDPMYCGATDCSAPETSGTPCGAAESCVVGECRDFVLEWSQGEPVSAPDFSTGTQGLNIETDAVGNAFLTWREYTDAENTEAGLRLFSRRFFASTKSWGPVVRVDDGTTRIGEHDLAVASNGDAISVWVSETVPLSLRRAKYTAATGTWGPSTRVDNFDSEVSRVQIAMAGNGDAHIVWLQVPVGETFRRTHYQFLAGAGGTPSAPVAIEGYGEDVNCSAAVRPLIAVNQAGDAALTFLEFQSASSPCAVTVGRAFAAIYDKANKTWSVPSDRSTATGLRAKNPVISIDAAGKVYLAWPARVDATHDNLVATSYSGGMWQSIVELEQYNQYLWDMSISASPDGGASIALYHQAGGVTYTVEAFVLSEDLGILTQDVLETGIVSTSVPKAYRGLLGGTHVVWTNGSNVHTSWWNPQVDAWTGPTVLNDGLTGTATDPQIAVAPSRQVYSAWHQSDAGFSKTYFARFD